MSFLQLKQISNLKIWKCQKKVDHKAISSLLKFQINNIPDSASLTNYYNSHKLHLGEKLDITIWSIYILL